MSRDVRRYLRNPDKLFRRVRDKHGNLRLSKAAKAYHPGRGVYRSSYRNALRLTATENNMAYRTADHLRWQQQPFVVGIEIKLSNNHTCKGVIGRFVDICDDLAGVYPKDFKFVGWHPHCRCYCVPKQASKEEFMEYQQRLLNGEDVSNYHFKGEVKDLPRNFKDWYTDNTDRIARAKSQPYFLRDNQKLIEKNVPIAQYGHKADKANAFNSTSYGSNVPANLNTLQQKDWISNEHDIENVLGKQGEPMTHEQANGNMPNPNYKVGIRDEYSINCQSCVVAYELRRRGYDVETLGRIFGDENNIPNKLAFHTELAWKDFEGKTPISKIAGGKNKTIENLKEEFNQHTLEIGRYHIKWEYARGNFAHIVTFERFSNGESIIYDAQTGALLQLEKIIKGANINNGIKILRVDNLLVNNDIINKVVRLKNLSLSNHNIQKMK